jgi:REP element-mobilizing transposase RayT
MTRVARSHLPDGIYHVASRGVPETPIFLSDADRHGFVRLLARTEAEHRWTCHAYCLMTTHYHLVIESTRRALSAGLRELNGRHARSFNRRHGRFGHLFAARFTCKVIDSDEYLFDACSYVMLNPVQAGLCDRFEDWSWSYSRFGLAST